MNSPQALIGLLRRHDKGISLTDGEILYCLSEIERYIVATNNDIFKDLIEDRFLIKLLEFKNFLLSEKRSRIISKIL
jgi:hypothetical protein